MEQSTVHIKQGCLKGKLCKSKGGIEYYSFCGIPYAKPPVGELRFKYPVPHEGWAGTRDATQEGDIPTQYDIFKNTLCGSEDCLFINVHTPKLKSDLLPVMVRFHGGGFNLGSGNVQLLGPEFLIEKGVVYVSMNYRLGVLGFLCTDPENARGDMGLIDQNLALKWTKENIKHFGGDPNNITIFGESAGAASVEYHILSDLSKDLFNKAIIQSGTVFSRWARSLNPLKHSLKLAKSLGYQSEDIIGVANFLKAFDSQTLIRASLAIVDEEEKKTGLIMPFIPALNLFKDAKGFLNEEPAKILKEGTYNKVSTMSGFCNKEGIFMLSLFKDFNKELEAGDFIDFIPNHLKKSFKGGNDRLKEIYKSKPDDKNENDYLVDLIGDITIVGGVFHSLHQRFVHNTEKHYFYNFNYDYCMRVYKVEEGNTKQSVGTSHCDDLAYLGTVEGVTENPSEEDVLVRSHMVEMWTNFAKYGDPTPENSKVKWLPITKDRFQYLEISVDPSMKTDLFRERREFWSEVYEKI